MRKQTLNPEWIGWCQSDLRELILDIAELKKRKARIEKEIEGKLVSCGKLASHISQCREREQLERGHG